MCQIYDDIIRLHLVLTGERVDAGREAVLHAGSYPRTAFNPAAAAAAAALRSFLSHIFYTSPASPRWACSGLLLLPFHWIRPGSGRRICCCTRRS